MSRYSVLNLCVCMERWKIDIYGVSRAHTHIRTETHTFPTLISLFENSDVAITTQYHNEWNFNCTDKPNITTYNSTHELLRKITDILLCGGPRQTTAWSRVKSEKIYAQIDFKGGNGPQPLTTDGIGCVWKLLHWLRRSLCVCDFQRVCTIGDSRRAREC